MAKIIKSATTMIRTFPSIKLRKPIQCRRTIVGEFLYFLEFDPFTDDYTVSPFTVHMTLDDGKVHPYTPTLLMVRGGRSIIVEIEYFANLEKPGVIERLTIGRRWASENNSDFELYTDKDILGGWKLYNLKILFRYARLTIPAEILIALQKLFAGSDQPRIPFDVAASALAPATPTHANPYLWSLLFHRYLETDLEQKLSESSMLSATNRLSAWAE